MRQHSKAIRNTPVFYNLPVFKSTDIHDRNGDRFAGRWSHEMAAIGAASGHEYPYCICVRDALLNREMKIWETSTQGVNVLF